MKIPLIVQCILFALPLHHIRANFAACTATDQRIPGDTHWYIAHIFTCDSSHILRSHIHPQSLALSVFPLFQVPFSLHSKSDTTFRHFRRFQSAVCEAWNSDKIRGCAIHLLISSLWISTTPKLYSQCPLCADTAVAVYSRQLLNKRSPRQQRCGRVSALQTRAMVNVDFSPALLLGMSLIAGGLALYQLRRVQPDISRDFDVIVSAVATFSGGILIFQVCVFSTRNGCEKQHTRIPYAPSYTAVCLCRDGVWTLCCCSVSY